MVQYRFKIREGSPEGIMEEGICERDEDSSPRMFYSYISK